MLQPSITSTEHIGPNSHDRSHVALIAQLVEYCTGNAMVVGSNPVQSLKIFSGHFFSSVMAAFASFILSLMIKQIMQMNITRLKKADQLAIYKCG